jgi:hypothetical protein
MRQIENDYKRITATAVTSSLSASLRTALILQDLENWLGRQDSNLGMPVPKTGALPLGDAPPLGHAPRRQGL